MAKKWSKTLYHPGPVELASCSFGQSSKVSYLQMLTAVCAVVNGGNLMQPYVVQRITAPDGTVLQQTEPTVKRRVISEETSAIMCKLMEGVVTDGTGTHAAVNGYFVGADCQVKCNSLWEKTSRGDFQPRHLRGR